MSIFKENYMNITEKSVVKLDYNLSDESGKIIDSSELNGSLIYIHGVGMMMPGIENAINGQGVGYSYTGIIEPEDGYGVYKPENVMPVPRAQFAHLIDQMEVGKLYNFDVGGGNTQLLKVVSIDDEYVTVDANHPYAGEKLTLNCTVQGVRPASLDELNSLSGESSGCGCGSHGSDSSGGCCSSNDGAKGGCCSSKGD
ncbi:peptidylprolyl isomerase [Thiospirochaeta perfilievii]|uniref:Peptidyl-prolyl cis-trans isomerase n=2 Tax=Thiospirochaeta perfilievii TaxID=252967 RepID=A0A5C1QEK0_9SPIO|nr:peptidylprolyl isomerase [Thiospirochaeta perfilievii]